MMQSSVYENLSDTGQQRRGVRIVRYLWLFPWLLTAAVVKTMLRAPCCIGWLLCANCICCCTPAIGLALGLGLMQVPAWHQNIFDAVETAANTGTAALDFFAGIINVVAYCWNQLVLVIQQALRLVYALVWFASTIMNKLFGTEIIFPWAGARVARAQNIIHEARANVLWMEMARMHGQAVGRGEEMPGMARLRMEAAFRSAEHHEARFILALIEALCDALAEVSSFIVDILTILNEFLNDLLVVIGDAYDGSVFDISFIQALVIFVARTLLSNIVIFRCFISQELAENIDFDLDIVLQVILEFPFQLLPCIGPHVYDSPLPGAPSCFTGYCGPMSTLPAAFAKLLCFFDAGQGENDNVFSLILKCSGLGVIIDRIYGLINFILTNVVAAFNTLLGLVQGLIKDIGDLASEIDDLTGILEAIDSIFRRRDVRKEPRRRAADVISGLEKLRESIVLSPIIVPSKFKFNVSEGGGPLERFEAAAAVMAAQIPIAAKSVTRQTAEAKNFTDVWLRSVESKFGQNGPEDAKAFTAALSALVNVSFGAFDTRKRVHHIYDDFMKFEDEAVAGVVAIKRIAAHIRGEPPPENMFEREVVAKGDGLRWFDEWLLKHGAGVTTLEAVEKFEDYAKSFAKKGNDIVRERRDIHRGKTSVANAWSRSILGGKRGVAEGADDEWIGGTQSIFDHGARLDVRLVFTGIIGAAGVTVLCATSLIGVATVAGCCAPCLATCLIPLFFAAALLLVPVLQNVANIVGGEINNALGETPAKFAPITPILRIIGDVFSSLFTEEPTLGLFEMAANEIVALLLDDADYTVQYNLYLILCNLMGPLQLTCPPEPPVTAEGMPAVDIWEYIFEMTQFNMDAPCRFRNDCNLNGDCRCQINPFLDPDDDDGWQKRGAGYEDDEDNACTADLTLLTGAPYDLDYPVTSVTVLGPNTLYAGLWTGQCIAWPLPRDGLVLQPFAINATTVDCDSAFDYRSEELRWANAPWLERPWYEWWLDGSFWSFIGAIIWNGNQSLQAFTRAFFRGGDLPWAIASIIIVPAATLVPPPFNLAASAVVAFVSVATPVANDVGLWLLAVIERGEQLPLVGQLFTLSRNYVASANADPSDPFGSAFTNEFMCAAAFLPSTLVLVFGALLLLSAFFALYMSGILDIWWDFLRRFFGVPVNAVVFFFRGLYNARSEPPPKAKVEEKQPGANTFKLRIPDPRTGMVEGAGVWKRTVPSIKKIV